MIIDVHGHIGTLNFAPHWTMDAAQMDATLARVGIDYCAVSSSKALIYDVAEGNAEVLQAVEQYPRILGWMVGHPVYPEASWQGLQLIEEHPRLVGCKMHPDYHGYDVASVACHRFMEKAVRYAKIFLFHTSVMAATNLAAAHKIIALARDFPDTKFILAHAAGLLLNPLYPYHPNYTGSIDLVMEAALPNVYIDLANGAIFTYPGVFETVVAKIGADRMLYGSDVPIVRATYLKSKIEEVRGMEISAEEKEAILSRNAAKLFAEVGVHLTPAQEGMAR